MRTLEAQRARAAAARPDTAVLLVGRSCRAVALLRELRAGGAAIVVHSDRVAPDLMDVAGPQLVARLPHAEEIAAARMLAIADLPAALALPLLQAAAAARVPVLRDAPEPEDRAVHALHPIEFALINAF